MGSQVWLHCASTVCCFNTGSYRRHLNVRALRAGTQSAGGTGRLKTWKGPATETNDYQSRK